MCLSSQDELFTSWLASLEARHLANFRIAEVTRALRALSSAYVQRRQKLAEGAALGSAGKRAAFALFYGPLHFLTISKIIGVLEASAPPPTQILDLGCGTGIGGAAWALCAGATPQIVGIDRHPWAVGESQRTYRDLGVRGRAHVGDLRRLPPVAASAAVLAAFTLNELNDERRRTVEAQLLERAARGTRLLVVEPISRAVTPWWDQMAVRLTARGGREDDWRFPVELPPLLRLLDKSAGLHHQHLTARSLYIGPGRHGDPAS
jgi:hypothetical protein